MNIRNKVYILNIVVGILLISLLGLGLSSFFMLTKFKKIKTAALESNVYRFERDLEDARTCMEAEQYKLAEIRLGEAIELLNSSRKMATQDQKIQNSFEIICKKYCKIWNDPTWNYRYQAKGYPVLQKGFEKFCE